MNKKTLRKFLLTLATASIFNSTPIYATHDGPFNTEVLENYNNADILAHYPIEKIDLREEEILSYKKYKIGQRTIGDIIDEGGALVFDTTESISETGHKQLKVTNLVAIYEDEIIKIKEENEKKTPKFVYVGEKGIKNIQVPDNYIICIVEPYLKPSLSKLKYDYCYIYCTSGNEETNEIYTYKQIQDFLGIAYEITKDIDMNASPFFIGHELYKEIINFFVYDNSMVQKVKNEIEKDQNYMRPTYIGNLKGLTPNIKEIKAMGLDEKEYEEAIANGDKKGLAVCVGIAFTYYNLYNMIFDENPECQCYFVGKNGASRWTRMEYSSL